MTTNEQPDARPRLTEKFVAARAKDDGHWHNPQADVTVMMEYMFEHVAAALRSKQWPEVVSLLAGKAAVDEHTFVEEDCRAVHNAVHSFIAAAFMPTPEQASHAVFMETLDEVGWRDLKLEAKVMYMYMLGLFHLSRCWVIGRQSYSLGIPPAADVTDIMAAAGVEFRMYDQDVTPKFEASQIISDAVHYAASLNLTESEVSDIVRSVYLSPTTGQRTANLTSLGKLAAKCCGGTCGKKDRCQTEEN
jgi:hypothetical protein